MIISSATLIYFSPTGTTKKIISSVVKGMGIAINKSIDLTLPNVRSSVDNLIEGDIVLIGVPVYATGIPKVLNNYLTNLKGNNNPIVLIAVYGNMSEGTVLNELYSKTENSGFKVIGAGSFIGEHSFSTEETPIAKGRPNYEDLKKAEEFGISIMTKVQNLHNLSGISLKLPKGEIPLMAKVLPKNSAKIFTKIPFADMNICNRCGVCVKLCPMGAINDDTLEINESQCLHCFCCVKRCPKKARKINYTPKFIVTKVLSAKNRIERVPKIYL